jgi:hypothetical protein
MKKRNLLIATVIILAGNLALEAFAQENIRAMIKKHENMGMTETEIVRENYPIIKKFNRSTTIIKLMSTPELEQQFKEAFHQDKEKAIHAIEQKKDDKTYMFYRFESSTYSYTRSNGVINLIECIETKHRIGVYTFFINVVPDDFRFPLIGFINTAIGSHQGMQAGFINTTLSDFYGAQFGFINSTLNNNTGLQAGFVNTTINELNGAQLGFVNSAGFSVQKGSQIGFVNLTRKEIKGTQIGFLNYADTITGVPIGFLSIVRKGGYKALEVSVNEWYPINLSFKLGVPKLYTIFQGSYNASFEKRFAYGYGFGSLLPLSKRSYFNPELISIQPFSRDNQMQIHSFAGNIRFKISSNLQIAAGPSISHIYLYNGNDLYKPEYNFVNHKINDKNRLVIGARAALSVNF